MNLLKLVKKTSLLLSLILVFSLSILGERLSPCTNSADCGKIIGWLYDYDTGLVVNEEFGITLISFINGKPKGHLRYEVISNKGYFAISVKQGQYVLAVTPHSESSKYPYRFEPYAQPKEDEIIKVEKGKITEVRKKLQMGGSLKVTLIDPNGQKIDIIQKYHVSKIVFNVKNPDIDYSESIPINKEKIEMDDIMISNLIPGIYNIDVYFPKSGLGTSQEGTFLIESKKTTEFKFIIKIDEETGIQGIIRDKNNILIASAEVVLFKNIENFGFEPFGDVETDENGFYKIIDCKEGSYSLMVVSDYTECQYHNIEIRSNQILNKDIILSCDDQKE